VGTASGLFELFVPTFQRDSVCVCVCVCVCACVCACACVYVYLTPTAWWGEGGRWERGGREGGYLV